MNWHYLPIEQKIKYCIAIMTMMVLTLSVQAQKVFINEINYRSVELQQDIDFVELYNAEPTSVNLSGWSLTEGIAYEFPAGTSIPAGGFVVVCADPATCQSVLSFSGAIGPYDGGLSGRGDEVILRNNLFQEVDRVDYESWNEWPNVRFNDYEVSVYDPSTGLNGTDKVKVPVSIQKMHPELPGRHGGSWEGHGPTPGAVNSNYIQSWTDVAVIKSVSKSPDNPVSGEVVRIKAEMRNLDLLSSPVNLELQYQIVEPGSYIHKSDGDYTNNWIPIPMLDDGMGADSTANNGTYTAAIPASVQQHRRLIRYRVKVSSPAHEALYPDQKHNESNYAYYVYDGYPTINGFDIYAVNPIQDVTIITGSSTAATYIGPGTGIDNSGQYTGYDYLGEGSLVYNGKVYDHVRFRPRGRTNGRSARVKPGVKFKLNSERKIAPDDDCGDEYDEQQGALTLSGTYVNDITTHGATESMIHKILNLTGAMGRHVDYTQFRVVDEVNEDGNTGDFWGVFLILENYDGDYFKEHDRADGNIWRHKRSGAFPHRMTYQGDFPNTDNIGDWSSHHPNYAGFVDRYLNHNLTSSYADVDLFISDKIANNFFANGANNYEGKHAQREYYNSETGKWVVWYGDYDTTFGMTYDDGTFFERSSSSPGISIKLVQDMTGVWRQYQNEMRSVYDLLFNQEQADFLVDMESRMIYDPAAPYDWTDLDHSRWNQTYDLGNVDAHMAWYKTWFQNRGDYLAGNSSDGFYDNRIPYTPTISLTGSGALDDMTFSNSNFADPQGSGTFSALEWRVGEWSDPSNPYYATVCDPIYEIETVWKSEELTTFSNSFTIPPEAFLKAGRTYKIRVRYMDNTGRWSHWSDPAEVIPTPATQTAPNIVINEIMYNPMRGCGNEFVEIINADTYPVDMSGFAFTDGIGFLFPKDKIMQPGEILVLARDSVLFELKYGFSPYGDYSSSLSNDGERIQLTGPYEIIVDSLTYNDKEPWDEAPDGEGPSLELLDTSLDNADPISWFRSEDICGTPGQPNSRNCTGTPQPIVINEINYNSASGAEAGDWVELHNTSTSAIDLSNWRFYDGTNEYLLPVGTIMPPQDFLVLVQNDTLFSATFPHLADNVDYIGNFLFSLSGGGERITLFDSNECLTDYVVYDDDLPWDTIPDGNGPTLSLIDPSFDNNNYNSWESSSEINSAYGTPGRANEPCPEVEIVLPGVICATLPITFKTDTIYDGLNISWFIQGIGIFSDNEVQAVWDNPGTYNVQLITDYYECRKISNILVEVLDCNLVPEPQNDEFKTNEDTPLTANVLANDSDPDPQDNLTVNTTPVTTPVNGTLVLNADGSFTYTPNPDYYGPDSFEYEVCDDGDPILCETALVTIEVIPVDDTPVAVDDTETTQEDTPLSSDVLPNDYDVDNDPLTATVVNEPANGTLVLNPDGTYTYTPDPDFNGTDSFEYEICDDGTAVPGNFVGEVAVGGDDAEEDTDINSQIILDSDDLEFMSGAGFILGAVGIRIGNISIPQGATITNARLEFVAFASQSDPTSLTVKAHASGNSPSISSAGGGITSLPQTTATASWNNVPAWTQGNTYQSTDISNIVQEIVNRNDWSSSNAMTFIIEGSGMRTAGSFEGGAPPKLIIDYYDGSGNIPLCDTAVVNITVESVNDAPLAIDDTFSTPEDVALSDNVILNDTDVEGNCTVLFDQPLSPYYLQEEGTATIQDNQTTIFLDGNAWKALPFNYNITANTVIQFDFKSSVEGELHTIGLTNDIVNINTNHIFKLYGTQGSNNGITDFNNYNGSGNYQSYSIPIGQYYTGQMDYLTFSMDNDANPNVGNSYFSNICVFEDTNGNGINDETFDLTVNTTPIAPPANGTLILNADGTFTYTPNPDFNGTDTFEYQVCDSGTPVLCDNAVVTITVNPVNDAPIAVDDTEVTQEDTDLVSDVLPNDSDVDGDPLTASVVTQPANGTLVLNPDGTYTYTPDPNFNGADSFEYEICDDGGGVISNFSRQVTSGGEDAEEKNDGTIYVTSSDLELMEDNGVAQLAVGIRMNDVYVPQGAVITNAYLEFVAKESQSAPTSLTINAEAIGYSQSIPTTVNAISSKPRTNATVSWNNVPAWTQGGIYQSADISAVVQEITDRNDWSSGNSMTFIIEGTGARNAYSFEGGSPPKLIIDYAATGIALCDTATVNITVESVNDAPIAEDDVFTTLEDTQLSGDVSPNDTDVDGMITVSTTPVTPPANGTLVLNADGTFTYTPNPDFNGTDSFEYEICDNGNPALCDIALVTINVEAINDAPIAVDDTETTQEDTDLVSTVLPNDSDVDGDNLTVNITPVTPPQNGSLTLLANGSYAYTPNANYNGTDSFEYEICDGGIPELCDTAIVNIIIESVNDAPIAEDDTYSTLEDTPISDDVSVNDSDVDHPIVVTTTPVTPPANGTLVLNADGTFTYTPNPDFNGIDSFEYEICDGGNPALCDTATVTINVDSVNDAPIAVDDTETTPEDTDLVSDVLPNDSDVDGDPLTATVVTAPVNGTLVLNPDGTYTYTPNANYNGTDSFEYEICDGGIPELCDTAIVNITIESVNDAPIAVDDAYSTLEDTPISDDVSVNDSDVDHPVVVTTTPVTPPVNGTLILNADGTFTYTPNPDFNGVDSFEYEICDGGTPALCDTATVTIDVGAINDAPIAVDDAETTQEDTPFSSDVIPNDSDVDGDPLTATVVTAPVNGTLVLNPDGTYTYTPNPHYNGTDSFEYEICDGGTPELCDTAIVNIIIESVNDAPVTVDDAYTTSEDTPLTDNVTLNDSDVDHPLVVTTTPVTPPANGTLVLNADGTFTYTPNPDFNGTDSFEYEICDGGNPPLCDTAMVVITVDAVNDAPIAVDDTETTQEDTDIISDVLPNDSDVDNDPLTASVVTAPANGTLVLNPDGTYTYTPNANYNGTDSFEYEICDGGTPELCDTAIVNIIIESVNDAPVTIDDAYTTSEDTPLMDNVTLNDVDVDHPLVVTTTPITGTTNGTLILNADGTFTYTPNPDFNGTDSFEYEICDGGTPALCDTAIVVITVDAVNDAPIAINDAEVTQEDVDIVSNVIPNDSDVDNDPLTVTVTVSPENGVLLMNPDGSYTYIPILDFNGTDSFEYEICDGGTPELCDNAVVNITIDPVNDAPVAVDDAFGTVEDTPLTANVTSNDSDVDHPIVITTTPVTPPANGTLSLISGGTIIYTPNQDFNGTDSFEYEICDGGMPVLCDTATVMISVGLVNDPPAAVDDSATTQEDADLMGDVLANDSDPDGDILTVTQTTPPANGLLVLNPDGTYTYTPDPDFYGTDSFEYEVCDNAIPALCDIGIVNITVEPVNDAPIAVDDNFNTTEDVSLTNDITINDIDVDHSITVTVPPLTPPSFGTLILNSSGIFTYTPNPDFNGTDSFEYEICDGGTPALCDTAMVQIVISPANDAPIVAQNLSEAIPEDTSLSDSVASSVTDIDGDNLVFFLNSQPTNGTLVFNPDGTFVYTPDPDFNGSDSFGYAVCDDGNPVLCTPAEMTINVSPVNDMPIAVVDTIYTFSNTAVQDNILFNDWDVDGDNLSSTIVPGAAPTNGTLTVMPNGNIEYTPNTDYIGTDYYEYEVCDDGAPTLCNTAGVTIIIDAGCVDVNLKVLLEGAYDPVTGEMVTTLNTDRHLLPGQTPIGQLSTATPPGQPYNTAPWNYTGTEGATWTDADYAPDVVDWVLVSFRTGISKVDEVRQAAGVVKKDGTVEFERCPIPFSSTLNSLYVVVEHRNHMGVMSAAKVPVVASALTYDFTTEDSYRDPTSFGQKQLPSGAWAMYAGDIDQMDMPSYDITGLDKTAWFENNGLFDIYLAPDLNFDGDVNGADKAIWLLNNGIASRVPK